MAEFELIVKENLDIDARIKKEMEAEVALMNERARIAAEKAEEEKRQKNVAHQKKINNEAVSSFMALMVEETTARALVSAIAKCQIANVFIKY